MANQIRFIGYPEAKIYAQPDGKKALKTVLWGDFAQVLDDSKPDFVKVNCRAADGWVKRELLQQNQLLEINFVDVGQGDGCFIVTPDDKFIVIDAGEGDHMYNFLRWRFNMKFKPKPVNLDFIVCSHSDSDHYAGFQKILDDENFKIKAVYHNGLLERATGKNLGETQKIGKETYQTEVFSTLAEMKILYDNPDNRGGKFYPKLMHTAYAKRGIPTVQMLEKGSEIPGYEAGKPVHLKLLGPVPRKDAQTGNKKMLLRLASSDAITKNGHSVIMLLHFGKLRFFLGGDLNEDSQHFLAKHYTGFDAEKKLTDAERKTMIEKGRAVFQCDLAKSCHHGSHEFMDDFFAFLNPLSTVISSGDEKGHIHPRPETIGAIGRHSRGGRPLIFSTELTRVTRESNWAEMETFEKAKKEYEAAQGTPQEAEKEAAFNKARFDLGRNVAVYGMICVRTDGQKMLVAVKKEEKGGGFAFWKMEFDAAGNLVYLR